jgi:hypothetical protein
LPKALQGTKEKLRAESGKRLQEQLGDNHPQYRFSVLAQQNGARFTFAFCNTQCIESQLTQYKGVEGLHSGWAHSV